MRDELKALFLDWFNNYLTPQKMAADYSMELDEISQLIELGRKFHEEDL